MKKAISALLAMVMLLSCVTLSASSISIGKNKITEEWKAAVEKNYNEFISEVEADKGRIPMIVSTDQHGGVKFNSEVYSYINELVDWNKISKIINLGDTVTNFYNPFDLLAYRYATRSLPKEKRIEIFGNHDGHIIPSPIGMKLFFPTPNAEKSRCSDAFVVKDEAFNVRYLGIDPMDFFWSYETGKLSKSQAEFLVSQLSKDDSSDLVLLSHPYLFRDELIKRDGTTFTGSEYFIGSDKRGVDVKQSFVDMLLARKNKTAGVLLDSMGNKHPYDFSSCEGDFLMTLHGHHHTEGYETSNGITEFLFQGMFRDNEEDKEPNCFYFAYIDTNAKTFKCWKNIEGYDAWEISIA